MPDEELARRGDASVEVVPALRGARSLVEAREYARLVAEPRGSRGAGRRSSYARALRRAPHAGGGAAVARRIARAIVRELKAVGGDLRSLRLALTGAPKGPELGRDPRRTLP